MNTTFRGEVIRNLTGYFLVMVGVAVIAFGAHSKVDKLTDTGAMLVSAALLAFQQKRSSGSDKPDDPK